MRLYEKNKDKINVYELKELRDKVFEYKRKEMNKLDRNKIVYKVLSNNSNDINSFIRYKSYDEKNFITKNNKFFIHKNGLKLKNVDYFSENKIIIDGLIYQLCNGDYNLMNYHVDIYNDDKISKNFILTSDSIEFKDKTKLIGSDFYKYESSNLIYIPESIYLLHKIWNIELSDLLYKNIDEQLSLYEFNDNPIESIDYETVKFLNAGYSNYYLTDQGLEVSGEILKKVRRINK